MKAIKGIMIILAIMGVLMEGFFLGLRYCVNKETDKVKTTHNSYVCEVSQTAGGYTYEIDGTVYSEADYVGYMEKAAAALPLSTILTSSDRPRMPPIKLILGSCLGSDMPRSGSRTVS